MKNNDSTSGMLEDMVRSMTQLASMELHAKTYLEKANDKLAGAEPDQIPEMLDAVQAAEKHLQKVTELRRNAMRTIASYSDDVNTEKWCEVKHAAMAMYTAFEAYQANESTDLYNYYMDCNDLFITVVAEWLGFNIPACASCFSDAMKGVDTNGSM